MNLSLPASRADREHLADMIIHGAGLAAALVGGVILLAVAAGHRGAPLLLDLGLYVAGLLAMLVCSGLYNREPPSPRKALLRRFDHAAIFLLIAGTYAPLTAGLTDFPAVERVREGVWAVALAGVAAKLFLPTRFNGLSLCLYLGLGWSGVLIAGPMIERLTPAALVLIAIGGLLYTAGVVFYMWKRLPYQKAIWHGFVVGAAGCHYAAVTVAVLA